MKFRLKRVSVLDQARHVHSIHDKVSQWFTVIGMEIKNLAILPENVYNLDEPGILLSDLGSLKALIGKDDLRNCRVARFKWTLVTAVERISANGRSLSVQIVWPDSIHWSTWTT
jgi:hypothetical protein